MASTAQDQKPLVHIDLGQWLEPMCDASKAELDHLCGDNTGDSEMGDGVCIALWGSIPAATTCARCKFVANYIHMHGNEHVVDALKGGRAALKRAKLAA